jgi:hypothetical protein
MALANIKRETAARMIAEDLEPDYRIAEVVGVSRRTIEYWKKRPDVKARIREIANEAAALMKAHHARLEWLREWECCQMSLNGRNYIMKRVALMRLREMGAI